MGIEDELRARAAAPGTNEPDSPRRAALDGEARGLGLEQALADVRQVAIEASELLRAEGLKPARLVYAPPDAKSYPVIGQAFSMVRCGYGWHVVRGVVVGTDGRLWARRQVHDPTPQKDLDAWILQVEPPHGRGQLPPAVEYDGRALHTVRWISENEYTKVDLIDRLTDGYARLLLLHHQRAT
ncbi:hypothetical protein [Kocuria rosea]|jgi:hypothetical protein|uniref:hypothetical protein n=1 Tax=Kocuria rosea TaxID=1275 RepID=UPI00203C20F6|nr:hypothetical protein [Kocuria rosea]MCM3688958.1 hypothetical protein [Kocuria rosea]